MKNFLILLTLTALLSSCGTFRKNITTTKRDSTSVVVLESITTRTISERLDTNITIKSATIQASGALDTLMKGKDVVVITPTGTTTIVFNKRTRSITATTITTPTIIPVHVSRLITETVKSKSRTQTHVKSKERIKDVNHVGAFSGWKLYISCTLFLLLLLIIARKLLKKRFPWIP